MAMFKKGDTVHYVGPTDWEGGPFRISTATVYSCGKKQMVLVNEAGEKFMGRLFRPQEAQTVQHDGSVTSAVFAGLTDEQAEAKALEVAAAARAYLTALYTERLTNSTYNEASVREFLARLAATTPSFVWMR